MSTFNYTLNGMAVQGESGFDSNSIRILDNNICVFVSYKVLGGVMLLRINSPLVNYNY